MKRDLQGILAGNQGGLSLSDLLVGLALIGLLAAAVFGVYQVSQNSYLAGAARTEVQETARVALQRMATEIREAGYDPTFAGGFSGLTAAATSDLTFTADFDEDGALDANETVRYYLSAADSTLHRSAGGVDEVLIDGVQTLAFTFLDGAGTPTATVANVRTIRMLLTTRPVYAQAVSSITTPAAFTTEIQLRNTPIP